MSKKNLLIIGLVIAAGAVSLAFLAVYKYGNGGDNGEMNAKIAQIDIETAGREDVINILGEPEFYGWGKDKFDENDLPSRYIMFYPNRSQAVMMDGRVLELRFHRPGFVYRDTIQVGSLLNNVLEVLPSPDQTVVGKKNEFQKGILYKDIDGKKGHCYYDPADEKVRLFFAGNRMSGLYLTR